MMVLRFANGLRSGMSDASYSKAWGYFAFACGKYKEAHPRSETLQAF